ncbi:MAG: hypothetical protein M3680_09005 [Myxococcota bacterium]|nr:hypothetical protein [Myxococcota bacterium]
MESTCHALEALFREPLEDDIHRAAPTIVERAEEILIALGQLQTAIRETREPRTV